MRHIHETADEREERLERICSACGLPEKKHPTVNGGNLLMRCVLALREDNDRFAEKKKELKNEIALHKDHTERQRTRIDRLEQELAKTKDAFARCAFELRLLRTEFEENDCVPRREHEALMYEYAELERTYDRVAEELDQYEADTHRTPMSCSPYLVDFLMEALREAKEDGRPITLTAKMSNQDVFLEIVDVQERTSDMEIRLILKS